MKQLLICLFAISCFAGCGKSELQYEHGSVQGKVTLDGNPLPSGKIRFIPASGTTGKITTADIKEGTYSFEAGKGPAVGKNRVDITATRPTGEKTPIPDDPDGKEEEVMEQYIPAKYNLNSELSMVVEEGAKKKDFELKSK